MTRTTTLLAATATTVGLALGLTACSSGDATATGTGDGTITVVASTNVYGDIAARVGGDLVSVTSIVDDPAADPHSFEPSAHTQLLLSKAALVVENGGGYDDFVDTMLDAVSTDPVVVNAVDVSGKTAAAGEELNEHVWYDFGSMAKVADAIADELGTIDPDHAATYTKNAASFGTDIDTLVAGSDAIKAAHGGEGVAITEPVPLFLLENAGLVDKTPEAFSEAIEEETDVPPTVLAETLALFTDHAVRALVYNEQTTGSQTERVLAAAKKSGTPVVPVTETMPEGTDYVSWMTANLDAVSSALAS